MIDDLRAALPADRLITDPDVISGYVDDEAEWAPTAPPRRSWPAERGNYTAMWPNLSRFQGHA